MTPEYVERTIEFILEHQAQATVHLEQLTGQTRNLQTATLILSDLAQSHSRRLERQGEEFHRLLKHYDEGQRQALARLDEILRRLTERG
jgi:hypothetical protein